jgi:hypothetical protein
MRIGRVIVGTLGLLALTGVGHAAERLVLGPYPGGPWVDVVDTGVMRERVPQGQTGDNFQDVLTTQTVTDYRGSPASFITQTLDQIGESCESVQMTGPTVAEESGREVAYGRVYCGRQKGQTFGIHFFFKAIEGSDGLYLVGRGFRTPGSDKPGAPALPEDQAIAFVEAEGVATKYLTDQVYVCDPVFPEARCDGGAVATGR